MIRIKLLVRKSDKDGEVAGKNQGGNNDKGKNRYHGGPGEGGS